MATYRRQIFRDEGLTGMDSKKVSSLLLNDSLKVTELRVLGMLLRDLDNFSFKQISVSKLAVELGMNRSRISLALKTLTEQKVVQQGQRIGRCYSYRLIA